MVTQEVFRSLPLSLSVENLSETLKVFNAIKLLNGKVLKKHNGKIFVEFPTVGIVIANIEKTAEVYLYLPEDLKGKLNQKFFNILRKKLLKKEPIEVGLDRIFELLKEYQKIKELLSENIKISQADGRFNRIYFNNLFRLLKILYKIQQKNKKSGKPNLIMDLEQFELKKVLDGTAVVYDKEKHKMVILKRNGNILELNLVSP